MKTWHLIAMMADGSSFASEVETFKLEEGVLSVTTIGLAPRVVEGQCIGVLALPRFVGLDSAS